MALLDFIVRIWPFLAWLADIVLATGASLHIILFKRDTRAAVAWLGLVWLAPFAGVLIYVVMGINRFHRRARKLRSGRAIGERDIMLETPPTTHLTDIFGEQESEQQLPAMVPPQGMLAQPTPDLRLFMPDASPHMINLSRIVAVVSGQSLSAGNRIAPLLNGDETYPAMLAAIEGAEHSVGLSTYIFDNDRAGHMFVAALERAMRRGVQVRVLIDSVGTRYTLPPITRQLAARKIPYALFNPSWVPVHMNYLNMRNHRKITVVDGRVGFTGGINIREGCLLGMETKHPVQDLHFRLEGPVVRQLVDIFTDDWQFSSGEDLGGKAWYPELEAVGPSVARGVPHGPDDNFEKIRWTIFGALAIAQRSVRIVTPYFLPDQALVSAINIATVRGVQVEILVPEKNNLRFVQWAMQAQIWQVMLPGCRVWLTCPPFDHSKVMIVDRSWALVGSSNWDPRSLRLNFEYNLEIYDQEVVAQLGAIVDRKRELARVLHMEELAQRRLGVRLRDGVARLFSPYL